MNTKIVSWYGYTVYVHDGLIIGTCWIGILSCMVYGEDSKSWETFEIHVLDISKLAKSLISIVLKLMGILVNSNPLYTFPAIFSVFVCTI